MKHETEIRRAEEALDALWPAAMQDLEDAVRIESTRGEPAPGAPFGEGPARALQFMLGRADELGFRTRNVGGYVGTADLGPDGPGLDILNHLDVVPAGGGWTVTQPFTPLRRGGRLYGRGAADNKGPAVSVLYALHAVAQSGAVFRRRVRLIWGCAEETGSEDIRHYYALEPPAPMTVSPDASFPVIHSEKGRLECHFSRAWPQTGLVRELSGGGAANAVPDAASAVLDAPEETVRAALAAFPAASAGVTAGEDGLCRVEVHGTATHAASPARGYNALAALVGALAKLPGAPEWAGVLAGCFPPEGFVRDAGGETVTASLSSLALENGVLSGVCDMRFPPCADGAAERGALFGRLRDAGFDPRAASYCEAHCVPSDSPFVRTLLECYRAAGGEDACCRAIAGNTYAHGIPGAVAFGFADPVIRTGTHGADEYVELERLRFGARVYIRAILELCC